MLTQAKQITENGDLSAARDMLNNLLDQGDGLDNKVAPNACELLERCELGALRNVQAMTSFQEAQRLYETCQMPAEAAYCRLMQVRKLLDDRMLREARQDLSAALRDALTQDWDDVYRLGLEFLGLLCFHTKELRKATGLLEESLVGGDQRKLGWEYLLIKLSLSNCYLSQGKNVEASRLLEEITADPRYEMIPRLKVYAQMNLGYQAYLTNKLDLAGEYFSGVLDLLDNQQQPSISMSWLSSMASYNLGQLALEQQEFGKARRILQEAVITTSNHGHSQLLSGALSALCLTELLQSMPVEALGHAALFEQHADQFGDIETRLGDYVLALVYLANNQLENAQLLWLYKPLLEPNKETQRQFELMRLILQHLLNNGRSAPFGLSDKTLEMSKNWLAEIDRELSQQHG